MSDSIGKVQLDLETNAAPFQQQLNGIAGKSTNMVTAAFGKLAKVAAGAFAVGKLIQFGKESVNLASDLQEVQNVVDVVFGESASQINNFAKSAITSYGLSELSAKRYSSTVGAMLKSMGLSGDAVLNMSQSITALAGDMASFYNLNSDDAFNKIRAGISGETEPLKQLGINMSQANLEAFALSQGITKSIQSMSQSEQALLRYNYLLSTTSDAQGDFARTSDSWANQTRILSEQMNSLKATMGSAFLAMLTPVVRLLNAFVSKLQTAAAYFKAFVEAMTGTKSESESATSGLGEITKGAEETAEAATKAKKALAGFDKLNVLSSDSGGDSDASEGGGSAAFDIPEFSGNSIVIPEPDVSGVESAVGKVKGMFGDLKSFITRSFAPSIKSWGDAFTGLKTPIESAVKGVKKSTDTLWQDTIAPFGKYLMGEWVPGITNSFSETLAPIFSDVMSFAVEEFAKDFEFSCWMIDAAVEDILRPAFNTAQTVFTDMCGSINTEWDKSGGALLEKLGLFRDSFKSIWEMLYYNVIQPIIEGMQETIDWLWSKHLKPLWDNIVQFVSKVIECVLTLWNNVLSPLVQWFVGTFGPYIANIINFITGLFGTIVAVVADVIGGILKTLGGLLDFITGVFSGDWKKAWEGIQNVFKGIWDALWGIVKGVINLIVDGLNLLWGAIYSVVAGIVNGIGGIAGALGDLLGKDWRFSMPAKPTYIPKLARGGIIDQPTLAMVGEAGKEAVVPLENTAFADSIANAIMRVLMPLLSGGNGVGKSNDGESTVIVLKVGEYELGRITVGAINKYHNLVGRVELEV